MSNPTEPTPPQPDDASAAEAAAPESAQPGPAPEPAASEHQPTDAQPTAAYPPADAQPTAAYPPADAQPTEAYPPAGQPAYGQPGDPAAYGQPPAGAPYGAPAYGAPVAGPAVSAADRPRGLAWAALGLAIGGLVLVGAAFLPLPWVSLVLALIGGLLLLVGLVLGIVALASKKQGGKGLGIGAIAVSVLGGLLWVFALTLALVWTGLAVAGSSSTGSDPEVSVSEEATPGEDSGEDSGEEAPAGTYDEAAYLAEVRPQITAILQEIDPSFSEDLLGQIYSDEMLVTTGKALLAAGDSARDAFVSSTVESSDGTFTEEQATAFYDTVLAAAEKYLAE